MNAAIDPRPLSDAVPAEAEPVAIGGLRAETRVQALVDQPVLGLEQQLVDQHRLPMPRHPSTHAPTMTGPPGPRLIPFGRWTFAGRRPSTDRVAGDVADRKELKSIPSRRTVPGGDLDPDAVRDLLLEHWPGRVDANQLGEHVPLGGGGLGLDSIGVVGVVLACGEIAGPGATEELILDGPPTIHRRASQLGRGGWVGGFVST